MRSGSILSQTFSRLDESISNSRVANHQESSCFPQVTPLGIKLGMEVIQSWLKDCGRTLTEEQWEKVSDAIAKCNLPLYAQLVFGEVRFRLGECRVLARSGIVAFAKIASRGIHTVPSRV